MFINVPEIHCPSLLFVAHQFHKMPIDHGITGHILQPRSIHGPVGLLIPRAIAPGDRLHVAAQGTRAAARAEGLNLVQGVGPEVTGMGFRGLD